MESYFLYLERVLGVKSLILPDPGMTAGLGIDSSAAGNNIFVHGDHRQGLLPILVVDDSPWSSGVKDLFEKMLAAMKLTMADVQVLYLNQHSLSELPTKALASRYVICFSELSEGHFAVSGDQFTKTISPRILLEKAELKRQAWEDLKAALKKMQETK